MDCDSENIKQSFFDILESQNKEPTIFEWTNEEIVLQNCLKDEQIYTGRLKLHSNNKIPEFTEKEQNFILYLHYLAIYPEEENSKEKSDAKKQKLVLQFKNPRLRILENGIKFRLIGYKNYYDFTCISAEDFNVWIEKLKRICINTGILENFVFGKVLGKGSFAKVHLANYKFNGKHCAIKTIEKQKILETPKNTVSFMRELDILRRIDHEKVIKLYEVYESQDYIHLVMEYLKGGELLLHLQNKGVYSEKNACELIKCVLEALEYLHSKNIIHRDLKPENLIIMYFFITVRKLIKI